MTERHNQATRGCVSPRINIIQIYMQLIGLIGLSLALYALYVEHMIYTYGRHQFTAICDLGAHVSCSDVLTSESSHLLFNIPNALLGTIFYIIIFIHKYITIIHQRYTSLIILCACIFSVLMSAYLATVLYSMGDACVLCISTYFVNGTLLILSVVEYNKHNRSATSHKSL